MIKRLLIALVLLVIVCGGLVGFNIFRAGAIKQFFANFPRPAITVSTLDVTASTWQPGIETFGTVFAANGTDVAVQTAGVVKEIFFKANQDVSAGYLLLQLDDSVDRADLLAAQTAVSLASQALERARKLSTQGVTSTVTVDAAEGVLDNATSQLARVQAVLDQKAIRARFAGEIGIPQVNVGQFLQVGAVIATLQDLSKMKVNFTVPERQLPNLKLGQTVRFGLNSSDLSIAGQINGIDPKVDPQTRLVSVQAILDNPGEALRPGQFIHIRVEMPPEPDVIAVPQTAVVPSLYGDFVFTVEPAPVDPKAPPAPAPAAGAPPTPPKLIAKQVFVVTGRRNAGAVEIVRGLKAGETIVTAGQNRLSNGSPVVVDNTVDPSKLDTTGGQGS